MHRKIYIYIYIFFYSFRLNSGYATKLMCIKLNHIRLEVLAVVLLKIKSSGMLRSVLV